MAALICGAETWNDIEDYGKSKERWLRQYLKIPGGIPSLTPSNLRLCTYLRMNLSKEIAPLLGISLRGVENHHYKLRKKFNLSPDENITDFILKF